MSVEVGAEVGRGGTEEKSRPGATWSARQAIRWQLLKVRALRALVILLDKNPMVPHILIAAMHVWNPVWLAWSTVHWAYNPQYGMWLVWTGLGITCLTFATAINAYLALCSNLNRLEESNERMSHAGQHLISIMTEIALAQHEGREPNVTVTVKKERLH